MRKRIFVIATQEDAALARIRAATPREALVTYLASNKVSVVRYGKDADAYVETDVDGGWAFAVFEPWAGTAADHTYFAREE